MEAEYSCAHPNKMIVLRTLISIKFGKLGIIKYRKSDHKILWHDSRNFNNNRFKHDNND